mgnify:CR=1 FL=1
MQPAILLILLILGALSATGRADAEVAAGPFAFPYEVMVYDLPTAANSIDYRLYVRPPLRDPGPDEKASSIYFLDPIALFVPAASMSFNYEIFNYMPASYFIGIGYQDEADGVPKTHNRTRDYTPSAFTPPNDTHLLARNPGDYEGSGGADAFHDVIETEIIPFVESQFDVDPGDRVLVGKSMSGLAAVHALVTRTELFKRYIIVSPAIWWDDWLLPRDERAVMRQVRESAGMTRSAETRAFFAVGAAEERLRLVTDIHVLVDALRQERDPNLKLYLEILDGEMHEGVFPAAFMKGIVGVYAGEAGRRPSASPVTWDP